MTCGYWFHTTWYQLDNRSTWQTVAARDESGCQTWRLIAPSRVMYGARQPPPRSQCPERKTSVAEFSSPSTTNSTKLWKTERSLTHNYKHQASHYYFSYFFFNYDIHENWPNFAHMPNVVSPLLNWMCTNTIQTQWGDSDGRRAPPS